MADEVINLQPEDQIAFAEALIDPPAPSEQLLKLRKAHAQIVYLEVCPACGRYSVPPDKRGRDRFCLKCEWVDSQQEGNL